MASGAVTHAKSSFAVYHGQGMVCLTLAHLSDEPHVHGHWLLMARTWFKLAEDADDMPSQVQTFYRLKDKLRE